MLREIRASLEAEPPDLEARGVTVNDDLRQFRPLRLERRVPCTARRPHARETLYRLKEILPARGFRRRSSILIFPPPIDDKLASRPRCRSLKST